MYIKRDKSESNIKHKLTPMNHVAETCNLHKSFKLSLDINNRTVPAILECQYKVWTARYGLYNQCLDSCRRMKSQFPEQKAMIWTTAHELHNALASVEVMASQLEEHSAKERKHEHLWQCQLDLSSSGVLPPWTANSKGEATFNHGTQMVAVVPQHSVSRCYAWV